MQRHLRIGIPSDAARAVADLRPLIEARLLDARHVRRNIAEWMEQAGETRENGIAMRAWLGLHLDGTAGDAPPPDRTFVRPVIHVGPGGLSVPDTHDIRGTTGTLAGADQ